jgi:hypothetical protein
LAGGYLTARLYTPSLRGRRGKQRRTKTEEARKNVVFRERDADVKLNWFNFVTGSVFKIMYKKSSFNIKIGLNVFSVPIL